MFFFVRGAMPPQAKSETTSLYKFISAENSYLGVSFSIYIFRLAILSPISNTTYLDKQNKILKLVLAYNLSTYEDTVF